ncbi:hypothetical protein RCL1_006389 [Eukaryota sp. TZLM3-RCL]
MLCPICKTRTITCTLQCGHAFCRSCITDWLGRSPVCAVCRSSSDLSHIRPLYLGETDDDALSDQTSAPVVEIDFDNSPRFCYEDRGIWFPYTKAINEQILNAVRASQGEVRISLNHVQHVINLCDLVQTNIYSGRSTSVKVVYEFPDVDWQFSVSSGYVNCSVDVFLKLEEAFNDRVDEVFNISAGDFSYEIDLDYDTSTGTQKNIETGRVRQLRRVV